MRGRSRKIQVFAGLATLAMVAYATLLAPGALSRAVGWQEDRGTVVSVPSQAVAKDGSPIVAGDEPLLPPPDPAPRKDDPQAAAFADPEKSADDFLARTRKEAGDAVDALNKEAGALRERLAKVEAGLARYKATLDALDANAAGNARRDEGEPNFVPAKVPEGGPEIEPAKAVPPPEELTAPPPGEQPKGRD